MTISDRTKSPKPGYQIFNPALPHNSTDFPPIYKKGQTLFWAKHGAPHTHIWQTPVLSYSSAAQNQFFCLRLAQAINLPVPEVFYFPTVKNKILMADQTIFIVEERFTHHSLPQIFKRIRELSSQPAKDLKQLLRWIFCKFLIGCDIPINNEYNLIVTNNAITLGFFQHVCCNAIYPDINAQPLLLNHKNLTELATLLQIKNRFIQELFEKTTQQILANLSTVIDQIDQEIDIDMEIIQRIYQIIEQRSEV